MKAKNLIIIALFAVVSFNFYSCKKGVESISTRVYGRITDYYSGQPITNAAVKLISRDFEFDTYIYDTIEATSTNQNGEYGISFHGRREDNISYGIFINKQPEGYSESFYDRIKKKHSNNLDFSMKGNAYLRIHIKNVTPFDNHDHIGLTGAIYISSGIGDYQGYGTNIDTNVIFSTRGQGSLFVKLGWLVTKNNITKGYLDSIYCSSMDTANYALNY